MGLDMYLTKKTYFFGDSNKGLKITVKGSKIDPSKVKYIAEEAGYWRKANAIHNWFVANVQDGEDDCREYEIDKSQLEELLKLVNKVLAASELVEGEIANGYTFDENGKRKPIMEAGKYIKDSTVAQELLPTQSGFFFGDTEYDQWYYQDLENTKKIIEAILEEPEPEAQGVHVWYEYRASW